MLDDSIEAWIDAINATTQCIEGRDFGSFRGTPLGSDALERSRTDYAAALAALATPGLVPDKRLARLLLFKAKALRKWKLPSANVDPQVRAKEAIDGFLRRNHAANRCIGIPSDIVYLMRNLLRRWLPYVDGANYEGRFGPGACEERWPHPRRWEHLQEWVDASPHWPEVPIGVCDAGNVTARLAAVPKDWYRDRLITVEPCYASFVQQWARRVLLESVHLGPLSGTAMDQLYVDAPAIQRRLALRASRTKTLATIDLKDASDNISWADVRAVFPPWVVQLMEVTRSPTIKAVGTTHTLHIYAGMGNATTFVVETLFFTALVVAYAQKYGLRRFCSTFGDDVICTSEVASLLIERGQSPSFVINTEKSFTGEADLRESCGIFAWNGEDITCPKIDGYREPEGLADLYWRCRGDPEFSGLAYSIAARACMPNWPIRLCGFPHTSEFMLPMSSLPERRWNSSYQRREFRVNVMVEQQRFFPMFGPARSGLRTRTGLTLSLAGIATTVVHGGKHYVPYRLKGRMEYKQCWLPESPVTL